MKTQNIIHLAVGVAVGFVIGFILANSVDRGEHGALRAGSSQIDGGAKSNASPSEQQLTAEELRRAVAKADANPKDVELQRKLGQGLYLYAINFNQPALLKDAARILKRAHEADAEDYETTVLLGNVLFDAAQHDDRSRLSEARVYFLKALESKPEDANVRTALGLTYYFDRPARASLAIREYRKSLAINPRHEMALQSLTAALLATGELSEAEKRLRELQDVNPSNAALPDLRAQLAQKTSGAR